MGMEKDDHIKQSVIDKMWETMQERVFLACSHTNERVNEIAINIVAYMHSVKYLDLPQLPLSETHWAKIEAVKERANWSNLLSQDIDFSETAVFNNLALEHGWDNLKFYSPDFGDRNLLLEQWYELEQASNNPIGMAAVSQLIKALNHCQYKAKQTQVMPDDYDPDAP